MALRITCINKSGGWHDDPHHAITNLGWVNEESSKHGRSSRVEMWTFVTNGGFAFVRDVAGHIARVKAMTSRNGTRYVQTEADGRLTDNLLHLSECP